MTTTNPAPAVRDVVPFYWLVVAALEGRRYETDLSSDQLSERMVAADRSWQKAVHADTPSGRIASWEKMQEAVSVLYPCGVELILREIKPGDPREGQGVQVGEGSKRVLQREINYGAKLSRLLYMKLLGRKGGDARRDALTPARRKEIAQHARRKQLEQLGLARQAADGPHKTA